MRIAANLSMLFTELPLADRVLAARTAGFDGVESQFPYELPAIRLKELLERAGLPLVLINLPAGDLLQGGAGLAAVPARQDGFDGDLREALPCGAGARPPCENALPGRLVEGVSGEQAVAARAVSLRKSAEAPALLGIRVLDEALNPLDMPGFLLTALEQLRALM